MNPSRARASRILSLLAVAAAIFARSRMAPAQDNAFDYASAGQFLIHGFAAPDARHLPAANVVGAGLVQSGLSGGLCAAVEALFLAILVLALEAETAGGIAAWTAAAAVLLLPGKYPQSVFSLFVMALAGLMVWRCREEDRLRTLVLSCAVGTTLLFRSTLAFLPPALALFEFAPGSPASRRRAWSNALILLLVPYLFLLPWIGSNWKSYGRLIPFEDGEASCNIVTGALGVVGTVEGPWRTLVRIDAAPDAPLPTGTVLAWAAREAGRHPLRYARAWLTRLGFAILWCSPWVLLAAWALWRERRRREFQALGLLCAYFLTIHCFMSIESGYFGPLLPLLAVLACGLAGRSVPPEPLLSRPAGDRILAGAFLAMLLISSYSIALLGAPPPEPRALDRAVERAPRDAWLRLQRGSGRLARGEVPGAAADLAVAVSLRPDDFHANAALAEAALFAHDEERALRLPLLASRASPTNSLRGHLIRAAAKYSRDRAAALIEMREAWSGWQGDLQVRGIQDSRAKDVMSAFLSASAGDFIVKCQVLIQTWPSAERRVVTSLLVEVLPRAPLAWIVRAETLARFGWGPGAKAAVLSALARAERTAEDREQRVRISSVYFDVGEPGRALDSLGGLSDDSEVLIEKAQAYAATARRADALSALARVDRTALRPAQRLQIGELYPKLGEPRLTLEELRLAPEDPDVLIAKSRAFAQLGERRAALAALARAARGGAARRQRLAVAEVYVSMDEWDLALESLGPLPEDADVLIQKARAYARLDRKASALSALARAVEAGVDRERRLRIAGVYAGLGSGDLALAQFDALTSDAHVAIEKAGVLFQLGRKDAARAALAEAAKLNPDDRQEYEIAVMQQNLERYKDALLILRKLLVKEPQDAELLNTSAICEYLSGSADAAVLTLRRALRWNPRFLAAYLTLGSIYIEHKRYPEAMTLYESALSRTKDLESAELRRRLAKDYQWLKERKSPH